MSKHEPMKPEQREPIEVDTLIRLCRKCSDRNDKYIVSVAILILNEAIQANEAKIRKEYGTNLFAAIADANNR